MIVNAAGLIRCKHVIKCCCICLQLISLLVLRAAGECPHMHKAFRNGGCAGQATSQSLLHAMAVVLVLLVMTWGARCSRNMQDNNQVVARSAACELQVSTCGTRHCEDASDTLSWPRRTGGDHTNYYFASKASTSNWGQLDQCRELARHQACHQGTTRCWPGCLWNPTLAAKCLPHTLSSDEMSCLHVCRSKRHALDDAHAAVLNAPGNYHVAECSSASTARG